MVVKVRVLLALYFDRKSPVHRLSRTSVQPFIFHRLSGTSVELLIFHRLSRTSAEPFIFHRLSRTSAELFIFQTFKDLSWTIHFSHFQGPQLNHSFFTDFWGLENGRSFPPNFQRPLKIVGTLFCLGVLEVSSRHERKKKKKINGKRG